MLCSAKQREGTKFIYINLRKYFVFQLQSYFKESNALLEMYTFVLKKIYSVIDVHS